MCEKHVFPAAVEQNERSQSLVWVSTPQRDNLFCFLFSGTMIVGLIPKAKAISRSLGLLQIFSLYEHGVWIKTRYDTAVPKYTYCRARKEAVTHTSLNSAGTRGQHRRTPG